MRKLLTAAALLALAGPAWGQAGVGQLPPLNVVGNPFGTTQPPTAFPIFSTADTWTALQTFSAGIQIAGPGPAGQLFYPFYVTNANSCSTGCGGLLVAGTLAGTQAGLIFWNDFAIGSDNAVLTNAGGSLSVLHVLDNMNGNALRGYRNGIFIDIQQSVISANVANGLPQGGNYVAVTARAETSSGDGGSGGSPAGGYWGVNTWCGNKAAALNLYICTGGEFDNYGLATSTQKYKFGINIADGNGSIGSTFDAAIAVYRIGPAAPYSAGRGWECGFCVSEVANSNLQPLSGSTASAILGTHVEMLTAINVGYGIDWRKVFCTQAFAAFGPGIGANGLFTIDCAGNIITAGTTIQKTTVLFGDPVPRTAGNVEIGSTTATAAPCPSGTVGGQTVAGCLKVQVGATTRWMPFF